MIIMLVNASSAIVELQAFGSDKIAKVGPVCFIDDPTWRKRKFIRRQFLM